jgi:hypothetical protein
MLHKTKTKQQQHGGLCKTALTLRTIMLLQSRIPFDALRNESKSDVLICGSNVNVQCVVTPCNKPHTTDGFRSSATSGTTYSTTRRYNAENHNRHFHRNENLNPIKRSEKRQNPKMVN